MPTITNENLLWVFPGELSIKVTFSARSLLPDFFFSSEDWGKWNVCFTLKLFWSWPEEWKGSLKGPVTAASWSTQKEVDISAELRTRKVKIEAEML